MSCTPWVLPKEKWKIDSCAVDIFLTRGPKIPSLDEDEGETKHKEEMKYIFLFFQFQNDCSVGSSWWREYIHYSSSSDKLGQGEYFPPALAPTNLTSRMNERQVATMNYSVPKTRQRPEAYSLCSHCILQRQPLRLSVYLAKDIFRHYHLKFYTDYSSGTMRIRGDIILHFCHIILEGSQRPSIALIKLPSRVVCSWVKCSMKRLKFLFSNLGFQIQASSFMHLHLWAFS